MNELEQAAIDSLILGDQELTGSIAAATFYRKPLQRRTMSATGATSGYLLDARGEVEWCAELVPTDYGFALAAMESRVQEILSGEKPELVWLLEHPPLYTAGTSAKPHDLLQPNRFPVYEAGRGGQYTYHGPGQRVAYVLLNLDGSKGRERDVRGYIYRLEEWLIATLAEFGVKGERHPGRVGIWVTHRAGADKIAAIGVRIRHWVTYHGVAINLNPNLEDFNGIRPCGISNAGICSLESLEQSFTAAAFDEALVYHFSHIFET